MSLSPSQQLLLLFISLSKIINNLLRKGQKFNEDELMLRWFMPHAFIVYQHTQNKIFMGLYYLSAFHLKTCILFFFEGSWYLTFICSRNYFLKHQFMSEKVILYQKLAFNLDGWLGRSAWTVFNKLDTF